MNQPEKVIPSIYGVDRQRFETDIVPAGKPVVLRGLNMHWPGVEKARQSDTAIAAYLANCANDKPAPVMVGAHDIGGTFFYGSTTSDRNFERYRMSVPDVVARLLGEQQSAHPSAVALQSALVSTYLPDFGAENTLSLLPARIEPRIWIGNASRVQTHNDPTENIACVVAGRRRFTLFPPDQIANLYIGPLENTLAGAPISMVQLESPDFKTYPRFRDALNAAMVAELEPGDAIFIPYFWWHHVAALSTFNVLVNYWWNDTPSPETPFNYLLHSILSLRDLPPNHRRIWKVILEHYVFEVNGKPGDHLPPGERGILGDVTPQEADALRQQLLVAMSKTIVPLPKKP